MARERELVVQLSLNSVAFAREILWDSIILIGVVFLAGLVLLWMREFYFFIAPSIIHHSHTWVDVINAVRLDFYLEIETIRLIVYAVKEALRFISAGRFPERVPKLIDVLEPQMLNASSLRQALKVSTTACQEIGGGWNTVRAAIRARTSAVVCPLLRAAWPLGAVNTSMQAVGSWLAYDSNPQGNNCNATDYDIRLTNTCTAINSGLIVLEVILPILLLFFIAKHYLKTTVKLVAEISKDALNAALRILTLN